MEEYDISQWRLAGTWIHTPSDPRMATGVRTGFTPLLRAMYPLGSYLREDGRTPMRSKPPSHVPRTHGGPTHVVGVPHAPREG